MAVNPEFLKAYKKATGQTVEKPGNAEHSAKFDRCVAHVQSQGDGSNAFAVCTAAMGNEAFKSMQSNDPNFEKEVEQFMRTLGIAGAGPVPTSLLAHQDLEQTAKSVAKSLKKDGSASLSVWYHDDSGNRKCEVYLNTVDAEAAVKRLKDMGYKDVYIRSSQDEETTTKAGDKCWVVRTNGMEYFRTTKKADAEEMLAGLTAQGQFAVMVEETVVSADKGVVEQTGKELNAAVREAAKSDADADSLPNRIKNIQMRRQSATIAAREKNSVGKSFKEVWGGLGNKKA